MCSLCDDYDDDTYDDDYEAPVNDEDLAGLSEFIDLDRLLAEVSYITIYPEKWDQGNWVSTTEDAKFAPQPPTACGTMGCLAGNAVIHADGKLQWERGQWYDYTKNEYKPYWKTEYVVMPGDENKTHIEIAARDLFGLTSEQADFLFSGSNDLNRLWHLCYIISDGKITSDDRAKAERERDRLRAEQEVNAVK